MKTPSAQAALQALKRLTNDRAGPPWKDDATLLRQFIEGAETMSIEEFNAWWDTKYLSFRPEHRHQARFGAIAAWEHFSSIAARSAEQKGKA